MSKLEGHSQQGDQYMQRLRGNIWKGISGDFSVQPQSTVLSTRMVTTTNTYQYLFHATYCSQYLIYVNLFNPHYNLRRGAIISPSWAEEKLRAWRGCHLPRLLDPWQPVACMTMSGTGVVSRAIELAGNPGSTALLGPSLSLDWPNGTIHSGTVNLKGR